jgi:hypothetical protein
MHTIKYFHVSIYTVFFLSLLASCSITNTGNNMEQAINIPINASVRNERASLAVFAFLALPNEWSLERYQKEFYLSFKDTPEDIAVKSFANKATQLDSWQEIHQEAQNCVRQTSQGKYAFYVQQVIATTMLNTYFTTQKPTKEVQDAVAYYIELLVAQKNYHDKNMLADLLPMLNGYWSSEKISAIARNSFERNSLNTSPEKWLQDSYYTKRSGEMKSQSSAKYSQLSTQEIQKEIEGDLVDKMNSFPKRSKVFRDPMRNLEEMKEWTGYNEKNMATLALLARGIGNPNKNK